MPEAPNSALRQDIRQPGIQETDPVSGRANNTAIAEYINQRVKKRGFLTGLTLGVMTGIAGGFLIGKKSSSSGNENPTSGSATQAESASVTTPEPQRSPIVSEGIAETGYPAPRLTENADQFQNRFKTFFETLTRNEPKSPRLMYRQMLELTKAYLLSNEVSTIEYKKLRAGPQRSIIVEYPEKEIVVALACNLQGGLLDTPVGPSSDVANVVMIDLNNGREAELKFVNKPGSGIIYEAREARLRPGSDQIAKDGRLIDYWLVNSKPANIDILKSLAEALAYGKVNKDLTRKASEFLEEYYNNYQQPDNSLPPAPTLPNPSRLPSETKI